MKGAVISSEPDNKSESKFVLFWCINIFLISSVISNSNSSIYTSAFSSVLRLVYLVFLSFYLQM